MGVLFVRSVIFGLLLSTQCLAESFTFKPSDVTKVYDGDTFTVTIPTVPKVFGDNISIRIKGIDAPEIRTSCAEEKEAALISRGHLSRLLTTGEEITILNVERDKYFRLLADVVVGNVNVAHEMLISGNAVEYNGGKKTTYCD